MLNSRVFSRRSNLQLSKHKLSKIYNGHTNWFVFQVYEKIKFSSSASTQLSKNDLIRVLADKEELIKAKQAEIDKLQSDLVRNNAEIKKMENSLSRNLDDQKFGKSLLDVSSSLDRACLACENFISEPPENAVGSLKLVKMLAERIEMVGSQLQEVIPESVYQDYTYPSSVVVKKYNPRKVEKYNPKKVEKYYPNSGKAAKPEAANTAVLTTWTY